MSSKGIADDSAFIQAFLEGNIVLSEEEEFVHDHLTHVIARISIIFDCNRLEHNFAILVDLRNFIDSIYGVIKVMQNDFKEDILNRQLTLLGILVDVGTAYIAVEDLKGFITSRQHHPWEDLSPRWTLYWSKHHPKVYLQEAMDFFNRIKRGIQDKASPHAISESLKFHRLNPRSEI